MTDPFSIREYSFPKDFIFGSATAGHQIEGNNVNSGNYVNELEIHEKDPTFPISGLACNSYEMWEQDNEILSQLKHQMYRMSIEWSRIEPVEGEFKQEEVDHYLRIFADLKKRGIKLCLSLTHGATPAWFWKKNTFNDLNNIKYFERYIDYIVPKVAEYVDYWLILNETNGGGGDPRNFDFRFNSVIFHAKAYHIIKKYSNKPVSTALMFVQQFGKRQNDKFDVTIQNYLDLVQNEFWLHAIRTGELVLPFRDAVYDKDIKDSCDFWAINSYRRRILDTRKANMSSKAYDHDLIPVLKSTAFGNGCFNAECLIHNLTRLMDKPVLISENGMACDNDDFRIIQLTEYLCAINQAMEMGVNVFGYLHWSLLDNYEWGSYVPRFGLVDVDRENGFKRTIKRSAYFYRDIIENGGFKQDILRKYLSSVPRSDQAQTTDEEFKAKASGIFGGGIE